MSKYDFNKQADFARATLGDVRGILEGLAGRDPNKWDLQEGAYNNILFHVFQSASEYQAGLQSVQDQGGRRKVKYKFPFRDGQTTNDLGAQPETFEVEVLLHGARYLEGYRLLMQEFNKPTPGNLTHPVRGIITVVPETWSITHSSETRKALILRVTFIQHSFTISNVVEQVQKKTTKSALSKALDAFGAIDGLLGRIGAYSRLALSTRQTLIQALQEYKNGYANVLGRMNTTFNQGSSADIPGLLPVQQGGLLGVDGQLTSDTFQVLTTSERFNSVPVQQINAEVTVTSVDDLAKQVNASRAEVAGIISDIKQADGGMGALEFYDDLLALKQSAVDLQEVLEAGIASSQAQVVNFIAPRIMSIREVAFEAGIPVDRVDEISLLNQDLSSVNCIEKGTQIRVPII